MKDSNWPTISLITPTFNSAKTLNSCLKGVRDQDYPQSKIEIILSDGGSTDDTFKIAKKHKAKVIKIPSHLQHAEYNRGVAFSKARGEFVLVLDHDNFLPYKTWLKDMVNPLLANPNMVATTTCYYHYDRHYSLLDRYFALMGTSEPLPYYLKKADRMPQTSKNWTLNGKAVDKGNYFLVEFEKDPRKIPSVGTNGCLIRRDIMFKYADMRPEYNYPIDIMVDVIKKGHNQFGFVKNSIIHLTHARGFFEFIKRRKRFVEQYHFQENNKRRWSVVWKGDEIGVAKYVIFSLTFVQPTIDSAVKFAELPDVAWFVHPFMCFFTTIIYGYVVMKYSLIGKFRG